LTSEEKEKKRLTFLTPTSMEGGAQSVGCVKKKKRRRPSIVKASTPPDEGIGRNPASDKDEKGPGD